MITKRIDAITTIPASHLRVDPPAPRSVKIELTGRCNYRCGFCALRTREAQPSRDMDLALFRRIVTEMREAGVEEIGVFYLGESFMNVPLLAEAVRFLKRDIGMPYVFLTSNASRATAQAVDAVMGAGLDSLKWSVNAADADQFKAVMGVSSALFEQALRNIATAWVVRQSGGHSTKLYASSIQYDGDQQTRMETLLENRVRPFVDEHYWLPLYSMGSFATQRERELGYRPTAGNQGRIGALRPPIPCWSAFTEGHVTADGRLSACCFDANGSWTMGDLNGQSFMAAWHSADFCKLREAHLRGDIHGSVCESCLAYGGAV